MTRGQRARPWRQTRRLSLLIPSLCKSDNERLAEAAGASGEPEASGPRLAEVYGPLAPLANNFLSICKAVDLLLAAKRRDAKISKHFLTSV